MLNNPLVSIISPCYNGSRYISRFLDSLLSQTYKNIELIMVNDGSTDNTAVIIKSYISKFQNKGYNLIYLEQENRGQSEAINQGLKIFKGDYITWLDSDDFVPNEAIETKVRFLEENKEYGFCISNVAIIDEDTKQQIGILKRKKPDDEFDSLFIDLIDERNAFFNCGAYMIRSSSFREVMPLPLQIEAPKEIGQNFQLTLPIAYHYKCGYIDKILYHYMVKKSSHSQQKHTYEEKIKIIDISHNVLLNICKSITKTNTEMQFCRKLVYKRIINSYINTMIEYDKQDKLDYCIEIATKYCIPFSKINILKIKYSKLYKLYLSIKNI